MNLAQPVPDMARNMMFFGRESTAAQGGLTVKER
jgi:hypothetical protein